MIVRKAHAINVSLEAYLYLQNRCHFERIGKNLTEKYLEKLKHNFEYMSYKGTYTLHDGSLGGCKGKPENSWEEHRWTSWSAADMARMLTEQGLAWEPAEDVEYINP